MMNNLRADDCFRQPSLVCSLFIIRLYLHGKPCSKAEGIFEDCCFISFEFVRLSSPGMMFPCHSSFNKTTEHKPKRLVKRHSLFCRIAMRPVFCQRPCEEIFDFLRRSHQFAP